MTIFNDPAVPERPDGSHDDRRRREPRGRREEDHRTVGKLEAVGKNLLGPLVWKLAPFVATAAASYLLAVWQLPEGQRRMAGDLQEIQVAQDSSRVDRQIIHEELDSVREELEVVQDEQSQTKKGVCLTLPLDYRTLIDCPRDLPPPRTGP